MTTEQYDSDIAALEARAEAAEAEVAALGRQLESDRTKVAECITKAKREIDSRHWITEGRGSYEWDDDRYREEFYAAAVSIRSALEPLDKIAADWSQCPKSAKAVAEARIDLEAEVARLLAALAEIADASHRGNWRQIAKAALEAK